MLWPPEHQAKEPKETSAFTPIEQVSYESARDGDFSSVRMTTDLASGRGDQSGIMSSGSGSWSLEHCFWRLGYWAPLPDFSHTTMGDRSLHGHSASI